MLKSRNVFAPVLGLFLFVSACVGDKKESTGDEISVAKGLYSFGPEFRSFTDCEGGREYWVLDSAKTLELAYANMGFEKPYMPVYIEVEYHYVKSDTLEAPASYDSTMVVTKLLKISKEIPEGPCVP
ncbi:MAG: hypothetical protein EOO90_10655 [Pedobacter sp.]|nr:MAG: hypothetical protein EOO90_10655 [Pedobacter sp.]